MNETRTSTTSGGAYYATATQLRSAAREARSGGAHSSDAESDRATFLTVGFEIAAAICCLAQAVEDAAAAPTGRDQ